jgi:hypothetical protein
MRLQQGGFNKPGNSKKNDNAHPPIHPTAHVANLTGDEKRVYEFITRRFLACCSMDALGAQTTVDVLCGGEEFYVTGEHLPHNFARDDNDQASVKVSSCWKETIWKCTHTISGVVMNCPSSVKARSSCLRFAKFERAKRLDLRY